MLTLNDACVLLGLPLVEAPPPLSQLPTIKPLKCNISIKVLENDSQWKQNANVTPDGAFSTSIVSASWLTNSNLSLLESKNELWDQCRNVIGLEVSLQGSDITYNPGDSIGIYTPNSSNIVQEVIERIKQSHSDIANLDESSFIGTDGLPTGFARQNEKSITLLELFTNRYFPCNL
jgi:sulfite reductase alpha subunit-like flavoprotein